MKITKRLAILSIVLSLAGCSMAQYANPTADNMVVEQEVANLVQSGNKFKNNIRIVKVTSIFDSPHQQRVDDETLWNALRYSLEKSGLLGRRSEAKYLLEAHLIDTKYPGMGASLDLPTTVEYILTEKESGNVVFKKTLTENYHVPFGDAWNGNKRLRLAVEGSIRVNIARFIKELVAT